MADDKKGFNLILKVNLPPEKEYHSGHSLMVQADTPAQLRTLLAAVVGGEDQAQFVLARFGEFLLQGGVVQALEPKEEPKKGTEMPTPPAAPKGGGDQASPALLKVAAKKSGKTVEELGPLTTAEAKQIIKEAQ